MRAGSQAPRALGTPISLPAFIQRKFSLSPNFHMSRTSRSMAFLKVFAPSHPSPGMWVGPARGCQGELSDSGARGRLRGRSETWKEKRRKSRVERGAQDSVPTGPGPPQAFLGPVTCCSRPWAEGKCKVAVGLREENLGGSHWIPGPQLKFLCSFTPFFIRSANTLYFGRRQT